MTEHPIRLTFPSNIPHVLLAPVDAYSQDPKVMEPIAVALRMRPATAEEIERWRAQP